jgi:hypothetical protein
MTRYVLIPKESPGSTPGVRRYSLGRVGVSPRSATGVDRHERLEQVASAERRRP